MPPAVAEQGVIADITYTVDSGESNCRSKKPGAASYVKR